MYCKNKRYWDLAARNQALFDELEELTLAEVRIREKKGLLKFEIENNLNEIETLEDIETDGLTERAGTRLLTHDVAKRLYKDWVADPDKSLKEIGAYYGVRESTVSRIIGQNIKRKTA